MAQALLSPPRVGLPKQFANFTNSTGGLDLTLRLIHGVAIVAAHVLSDPVAVQRCWATVSQLNIGRRYLRFFCFLDCFQNAHDLMTGDVNGRGWSLLEMMEMVESTLLGLYFVMEDFTMLHDMAVWEVSWYTPVLVEANKLWLYAICLSIMRTLCKPFAGPESRSETPKEKSGSGDEKESVAIVAPEANPTAAHTLNRLVIDSCDLMLPASFLGWVPLGDFEVGIAMIISSVLCWPGLWAATQR